MSEEQLKAFLEAVKADASVMNSIATRIVHQEQSNQLCREQMPHMNMAVNLPVDQPIAEPKLLIMHLLELIQGSFQGSLQPVRRMKVLA